MLKQWGFLPGVKSLFTRNLNQTLFIYNFKFSEEALLKAEKLGREATGVTAMIIRNENETADLDKGRN